MLFHVDIMNQETLGFSAEVYTPLSPTQSQNVSVMISSTLDRNGLRTFQKKKKNPLRAAFSVGGVTDVFLECVTVADNSD